MDAITPSSELLEVHTRIRKAILQGDREALENLWVRDPCALLIGSAEYEWEAGRERIIAGILTGCESERVAEQTNDRSQTVDLEIHGWQKGSVGWVTRKTQIVTVSGAPLLLRTTYIFCLEAGQWRCAHIHNSHPVNDEDVYGFAPSLEAIAAVAALEIQELPVTMSSGGTTTLAFTDIEASTEMVERLGDARWMELLRWHDEVINRCTESYGGQVVKTQGDGSMLAFQSAAGALDAVLSIQAVTRQGFLEQPVRIRVGVHAGDAVRERNDFYGHAVIVAARVATKALGGEVLATELIRGLVAGAGRFRFGPSREVELKGIAEPFVVHPVVSATDLQGPR
jgi:class 3 adenylate cyclase